MRLLTLGEMRILGSKPSLSAAEAVEGEIKVTWREDSPDEVKNAAETFQKYLFDGWLAFSVTGGKKTQIFTFNKNLEQIVLAPVMFGG
jgi:hypothetical protein